MVWLQRLNFFNVLPNNVSSLPSLSSSRWSFKRTTQSFLTNVAKEKNGFRDIFCRSPGRCGTRNHLLSLSYESVTSYNISLIIKTPLKLNYFCHHWKWRSKDEMINKVFGNIKQQRIDLRLQSLSVNPDSLIILHTEWQQNASPFQHFKCLNSFREFSNTGKRQYSIGIKQ